MNGTENMNEGDRECEQMDRKCEWETEHDHEREGVRLQLTRDRVRSPSIASRDEDTEGDLACDGERPTLPYQRGLEECCQGPASTHEVIDR